MSPDQGRGVDRQALAMLAVASGAILAWRAIPLAALRDPIAAWPWPGGDTWDFVAAGLELRGAPLDVAMRAPMLPLLVALGDASGLLGLVPLVGLVAACAAPVLLAREVAARAGGFAASAAALALLVSQTWLRFGLDWMADVPAAAMFALAAATLAPAKGPPRWIRAGILGGLATITSPLGLFLLPLAVGAVAFVRPHGAEARRAAVGIVLPLAFAGAWFAAKTALVVVPSANVRYWSLLGFHPEDLPSFLWQVLSGWGWPGSLAALVGLVVLGCRARVRPLELVPIAAVLGMTTFWGVLYGFRAPRFAVTLLPLLVLPTALGLAAIPRRMLRVAAALAVVLAAAWPLPGFVAHGVRLPLVPFPPLVVRVPLTWEMDGSVTPQVRAARLARETPRIEDLAWIAARRPVPPPTTVVAGAFDEVAGVLLADAAPEHRYERTRHLAALVRAPAVRASRLAIEVLPFGRPRPLGTRGPFAFTRVQSPLDGRDWILAVPAGEEPPRLQAGSPDADELERARAVARRGAGRHVVAVVEPGASWWAWLCLLVPGEWLHYVVPEDLAGFETFLAGANRHGPVEQLHGLSVEPIESLGRVGIVVRAAD